MSGLIQEEKQQGVEIIYTKEEDAVKALLAKMRKLKIEKDMAIGNLLLHLAQLQDEIHAKSLPFDHESEKLEVEIRTLMPTVARTIKTEDGSANFRKSSVRVTYDSKALDTCTDEYVKQAILPHRKETQVNHSVSIEVY